MAVQRVSEHTRMSTGTLVGAYQRLTPGSPRPRKAKLAGAPSPSDHFMRPDNGTARRAGRSS